MPKKKSSRPSSNLGPNLNPEPKSASTIRRERTIRIASIVIILALVLSVLAGALSITPAQAAQPTPPLAISGPYGKTVQIQTVDDSPLGTSVDTDGDGIINNEDSDIDGDGLVNASDDDIDGDGVSNFDDGDPAATNGYDGKKPAKPGSVSFQNLTHSESIFWVIVGVILTGLAGLLIWRKTAKNRGKTPEKNI